MTELITHTKILHNQIKDLQKKLEDTLNTLSQINPATLKPGAQALMISSILRIHDATDKIYAAASEFNQYITDLATPQEPPSQRVVTSEPL